MIEYVLLIAWNIQMNTLYDIAEVTNTYELCFTSQDNIYYIESFAHLIDNPTDYFVHIDKTVNCIRRYT